MVDHKKEKERKRKGKKQKEREGKNRKENGGYVSAVQHFYKLLFVVPFLNNYFSKGKGKVCTRA